MTTHPKQTNVPRPLPRHVAVIMDGNGRWALQRGQNRIYGHMHGVETVRKIVKAAHEFDIPYLTLYTFSTENWQRPQQEVDALMRLLAESLRKEEPELIKNQIKLQLIGDKKDLPHDVQHTFSELEQKTENFRKLTLSLAINYGGRAEILHAVNEILRQNITPPVSSDFFERYLHSGKLPDVDFLIRTGGEKRISNFLLWKIAYAELYFTDILWPDFNKEHFLHALKDYAKRERRYGKTSEQIRNEKN